MGWDLIVGDKQVDMASISGLAEFRSWVDALPETSRFYAHIQSFLESGSTKSAALLAAALRDALARHRPASAHTVDIVENLLEALKGEHGEAFITDGFVTDDGEEVSEDEWHVTDDDEDSEEPAANSEPFQSVDYAFTEDEKPTPQNLYGNCPKCGAAGAMRERRPNGDDMCEKGCVYPSASAVHSK